MTEKSLLVKQETYLEAGIHIGTKIRTFDMRDFVFKRRDDGLYILDLRKTDERLLAAAKLMGKLEPKDVLIVASRAYSSNPAKKFSELTGIPILPGRFIPGTMTNLSYKGFKEPKLLFVCDPKGEREAITEAAKNGIPVIALCDTDNETKYIDMIIPANNKGRRALALIFYILTRELMLSQGKIKSYDEYDYKISQFEEILPEEPKKLLEKVQEKTIKEKPVENKEEKPKETKKEEKPKEEKKKSLEKVSSKEGPKKK